MRWDGRGEILAGGERGKQSTLAGSPACRRPTSRFTSLMRMNCRPSSASCFVVDSERERGREEGEREREGARHFKKRKIERKKKTSPCRAYLFGSKNTTHTHRLTAHLRAFPRLLQQVLRACEQRGHITVIRRRRAPAPAAAPATVGIG